MPERPKRHLRLVPSPEEVEPTRLNYYQSNLLGEMFSDCTSVEIGVLLGPYIELSDELVAKARAAKDRLQEAVATSDGEQAALQMGISTALLHAAEQIKALTSEVTSCANPYDNRIS